MEQAWSSKFEQTSLLSQSGLRSYSKLYVRKRRLVVSNSLKSRIGSSFCCSSLKSQSGSSFCCRNPVNNIKLLHTLTGKGKSLKASGETVYDAYENESQVGEEGDIVDDVLNIVHTVPREGNKNVERAEENGLQSYTVPREGNKNVERAEENGLQPYTVPREGNKNVERAEENGLQPYSVPREGNKNVERAEENGLQPWKWPLWLIGPSMLLATGAIPTLWLPFSSISPASNMTSLLSLTGLDGTFNMGASIFLLAADYCARSKKGAVSYFKIPFSYMFWNILLNLVGLLVPSLAMAASYRSLIEPKVCLISFAAMLGPYLMLLLVQMLAEILTWHWKSPVALIVPVVYEAYRLLQLSRSLELGMDLHAPSWLIQGLKGLVAWWVLVLGMQLMKIAWFVGQGQTRKEA